MTWRVLGIVLAGMVSATIAVLPGWDRPLVWDSAAWLTIAHCALEYGLWPYRDLAEVKWPFTFLELMAAFTVLPVALWSVRLVSWGWYVIGSAGVVATCRRTMGWPLAVLLAVLWARVSADPRLTLGGYYLEEQTAAAEWAMLGALVNGWPALAGVVLGFGIGIKPIALAVLPAAVLLGRGGWRTAKRVLLGCGLTVLVIECIALAGAGPAVLEWTVWKLPAHGAGPRWHWPVVQAAWLEVTRTAWSPWALATGIALVLGARHRREAWAAAAWLSVAAGLLVAQTVPVQHRWIPLVGPALLLVAMAVPRWAVAGLAVTAMLIMATASWRVASVRAVRQLVTGAWPTVIGDDAAQAIAAHVRARTMAGDRIAIEHWNGSMAAVYVEADRCPASPFLFGAADSWRLFDRSRHEAAVREHAQMVLTPQPLPFLQDWMMVDALHVGGFPMQFWARPEETHP